MPLDGRINPQRCEPSNIRSNIRLNIHLIEHLIEHSIDHLIALPNLQRWTPVDTPGIVWVHRSRPKDLIVMVHVAIANIVMAHIAIAYIVMANAAITYIAIAYTFRPMMSCYIHVYRNHDDAETTTIQAAKEVAAWNVQSDVPSIVPSNLPSNVRCRTQREILMKNSERRRQFVLRNPCCRRHIFFASKNISIVPIFDATGDWRLWHHDGAEATTRRARKEAAPSNVPSNIPSNVLSNARCRTWREIPRRNTEHRQQFLPRIPCCGRHTNYYRPSEKLMDLPTCDMAMYGCKRLYSNGL